jgi:hypothetical protein
MRAVPLAAPLPGLLILIGAPAALAKKDTPDVRADSHGLPKVKFKNGDEPSGGSPKIWRARRDSNSRPPGSKPGTLSN